MTENSLFEHASQGGKARAKSLSAEERSAIARTAVMTRWEKEGKLKAKILKATHGDPDHPLRIGSLEIPCYVLEGGMRVLSGRGMQAALGMAQGHGALLTQFLSRKNVKPHIGKDLAMAIDSPIRFIRPGRGGKLAVGYEATILADICDVILEARKESKLTPHEELIAGQCEVLTRAFAKVGIIALVDEATGYQDDRARDALAKILENYIAKELRKWVKTFPSDFYKEMFRLRGLPYGGAVKKPSYVGHLTNDLVYSRLAPGVLDELRRKNPTNAQGRRKHKHFQWLTEEVGNPKLMQHLFAITILMKANDDWDTFHLELDKVLPKFTPMPLFDQAGTPMQVE